MSLLLGIIAISMDSFFASFSYSVLKVKIPMRVKLLISVFAGIFIYIAYIFAGCITNTKILGMISSLIFIILAYSKIFNFDLTKVNNVDKDHDKIISFNEGVFLATCLSLDAIAIGIYTKTTSTNIWTPVILAILINFILINLGTFLGKKIKFLNEKISSLLSGLILLLLALYNIAM